MKTKSTLFKLVGILLSMTIFGLFSCSSDEAIEGVGQIKLNITDAPIDQEGVTGVFITFTGIEFQKVGGPWQKEENFEGPKTINLLELQNGKTELLGEFSAEAGTYKGIRFMIDAPARGGNPSNPGCFIEFEDGSTVPLFVPSGAQTGYKTVGEFTVPLNGSVEITADFDLRRSVVKAGASGIFILKPTIKIIVNNESGSIKGNVSNRDQDQGYVVYAYPEGTYTEEENETPEEEENRFPNAVSNTRVEDNGDYTLAFLAPKVYDLVVVEVDENGLPTVVKVESQISVNSREVTVANIDLED